MCHVPKYLLAVASLLIFNGCEFDMNLDFTPKRDDAGYFWSEAPLDISQFAGIWASSPNDLWVLGWYELYHYNGSEWKRVEIASESSYKYSAIYGFGPDNIYIAGSKQITYDTYFSVSPLILHYNGKTWASQLAQDFDSGIQLNDIHGQSPGNIWAVGSLGSVYHYDGSAWSKLAYPDTIDNYSVFTLPDGRTFMCGDYYNYYKTWDLKLSYFSEFIDGSWYVLDTSSYKFVNQTSEGRKFGCKDIWAADINSFYTAEEGVFKYTNPGWQMPVYEKFESIHGSSWENIYAVGRKGEIWRFNGSSWIEIVTYAGTAYNFWKVFSFENQFYVLADLWGEFYIFCAVDQKKIFSK